MLADRTSLSSPSSLSIHLSYNWLSNEARRRPAMTLVTHKMQKKQHVFFRAQQQLVELRNEDKQQFLPHVAITWAVIQNNNPRPHCFHAGLTLLLLLLLLLPF